MGVGRRSSERRPHPIHGRHAADAESSSFVHANVDAEDGAGRNVLGNSRDAATTHTTTAEDFARNIEAEGFKAGSVHGACGPRGGTTTPPIRLREVQSRDMYDGAAYCFNEALASNDYAGPRSQRGYCEIRGRKDGSRSGSSTTKATVSDTERVVLGKEYGFCEDQARDQSYLVEADSGHSCDRGPRDCDELHSGDGSSSCACHFFGKQPSRGWAFDDKASHAQQGCEHNARLGYAERLFQHECSSGNGKCSDSSRTNTHVPIDVALPRRHSASHQEHTCSCNNVTYADRCCSGSESRTISTRAPADATDTSRFSVAQQFSHGERPLCRVPFASKDIQSTPKSPSLAPSCQGPFPLDGSSEAEGKTQQATVARRPSQGQTVGQVASRIRELELKSAIHMPHHFQPAGHYRHVSKKAQARRDDSSVDLIFPLHIHRFPRRASDGTPHRPETPIHRSVPDDEPYIHSPQPSRSMPMLKDPPESETKPEPHNSPHASHDDSGTATRSSHPANRSFAVHRMLRP